MLVLHYRKKMSGYKNPTMGVALKYFTIFVAYTLQRVSTLSS